MILFVRSDIARSMMSATAMMDAARRNQIGQPAACSIANNRLPYSFSDRRRGLYGKRAPTGKLTRRSKSAPAVAAQPQAVVDLTRSTQTCGQVCGLSMSSAPSPPHEASRVGHDQKLSSVLVYRNMRLAQRIGLRGPRGSARRYQAAYVDSVGSLGTSAPSMQNDLPRAV